jgi:hypothetical protein
LERGDIKGLQRLITEALHNYIKKES